MIDGYSPPFRLDRDNNGGGIMLFVREDFPCKLLSVENHPMEGFYVEINLRKTKWLLCCSYNPSRCKIDFHLENLNRSLALFQLITKISLSEEILMWRQMIVLFQYSAILMT